MKELFSVKGKVALVTGGSRGIGLMIAKGYVQSGAKVYISSRNSETCKEVEESLSKFGDCISIPTDLSKEEGVLFLVEKLKQLESRLDILVNNAGKTWGAPLEEYPMDAWNMVMKVNVSSPFQLIKELLPLLKAAGKKSDPARVINIGSPAGSLSGGMNAYAYNTSKAALHHLTRVLAKDLAKERININTISPGPFPSKMTNFKVGDKTFLEYAGESTPQGRSGTEKDMIATALFLSSIGSSYITGALIPLDGGTTLGT
ncbi:uncharacterized protein METZ01_LOCUS312030 [marine metagenome]|uniref:3-oxoacyl-ACP reductase n=1 Tax=marine metagenome TaxID=408172 RepID=A0A382NDP3_9ZZZZ